MIIIPLRQTIMKKKKKKKKKKGITPDELICR